MKPPQPCTCHVHQTGDYSLYSRNLKLNRQVRKYCLSQAKKLRERAKGETDPEEKALLEKIAVCAEWHARISLQIIREVKPKKPSENPTMNPSLFRILGWLLLALILGALAVVAEAQTLPPSPHVLSLQ